MRLPAGIPRLLVICAALLPQLAFAQGQGRQKFKPTDKYVPGQVIVRYKDTSPAPKVGSSAVVGSAGPALSGATVARSFKKVRNLRVVQLAEGTSVQQAIEQLRADPNVLYAEPDYIVHTEEVVPNDTMFSQLWAMKNTGQSGGTIDADIDATDAWTLSTGSNNVIVGNIDSGVDYNHPDLAANIFSNPAECNGSYGIDDDGNGSVDDCHGINPVYGNSDPYDDNGHGTHTSGTIGALGNNGLGVVGVNWHVTILPCKFLDSSGFGPYSAAIACLDYFATMKDLGYNIVATNNSWGGGGYSQALYDAIKENMDRGILFIAAAGNGGADHVGDDNDQIPNYPSNFDLPNIIAVAATTRTDARSSFSNFGRRTVDLGAPGSSILSTLPGDQYGIYDGTSMATPHVTGVAALLKAYNPALEWYQIRNLILAGGEPKSSMASTFTGRRLNAYGSLTCSNHSVSGRMTPDIASSIGGVGDPVLLTYLNINCKDPAGAVNVTASPGGTIPLHDDGANGDLLAGDGIYSAALNTSTVGTTSITFPGTDTVSVKVLRQYEVQDTPYAYRTIAGTNLQFTDELAKAITPPFPILFGGSSFSTVYVGSNGVISFDKAFNSPFNSTLPAGGAGSFVAPWWQDFDPLANTNHNIFATTLGTAPNREWVIEWRDVPLWDPYYIDVTQTVKFQVVFFEGKSDVLFNYANVFFNGTYYPWNNQAGSGTIGIQVAPHSATLYSYLQSKVNNGSAILWTLEPDAFTLDLPQPLIKTYAGQSPHFDLTVKALAGFNSDVTITCGGAQPPANCTPVTVHPTHDGVHAQIAVSDPSVGDKVFQLVGTAAVDSSQQSVPATLQVSDLAIDPASPGAISVPHGASSQDVSVLLHALGPFDSAVNMSCEGLPAGASCRFTPSATVYPTSDSPLPVTVNVDTAFSTPLAATTFQIKAWPAGMTAPKIDSVGLTTLINTDFSLTPSAQSFTGGMAAGYKGTVVVEAHDGYTGTVNLSCSVIPAGPACSLDSGSTSTFPLTLNVTVGLNGSQADDYHIVITGNDGAHSHTATTIWHVSGFRVTVPPAFSIYANGSTYVPMQVTYINGYSGDLSLSCGNGTINCGAYIPSAPGTRMISAYFSSPDAQNPVPAIITVSEYYPGTYKVQSNTVVTVKGFTLTYGSVTNQTVFPGETPQPYQITLTPYNGYDLATSFYCNGNFGYGTCSMTPASPWVPNGSPYTIQINTTAPLNQNYDGGDFFAYGNFYANVQSTAYVSLNTSFFQLHVKDFVAEANPFWVYVDPGGSSTATVTPYFAAGLNTPIQIACSSPPAGVTCDLNPIQISSGQTSVLTITANPAATPQATEMNLVSSGQLGANSATRNSQLRVVVQTFNALSTPITNTVVTGSAAQYQVSFTSPNGYYMGNITISCANLPPGVTCQPNSTTVPYSGYASSVTVGTTAGITPPGANTITLTAASAGISRNVPVTLNVQDFTITSANPSASENPGASAPLTVVSKSFAGFSSPVLLACAGLSPGVNCSFSGNNVVPSATGTSTTVTIATTTAVPGGVYPFTINATSQGQTRALNATLTVKDFHLNSTPNSRNVGTVPAGQTDHTTYALSAFADNGFNSSVALSCVIPLPTGVTCAFSPSSLTPSGAGTPSTLTVNVSNTTPPGTFTINVKGVSGSITRQIPLTLNTGGPNYTQAVTPTTATAIRGTGASYTVTYTPLGGMSAPIAVGCSTPAPGMTCAAVPDTVIPDVTSGNQAVVTFTSSDITPAANTMVTITGSALGIVRSNTVTLAVKDFSLTSTTVGDLSVNVGASAARGAQLKSLNGFSGSVALACSVNGSPAGVACTVPASAAPTATGVNVNATIATTAGAPAGAYLVTVSGTNSGQTRQYQFTVQIRDYTVNAVDPVSIGAIPTGQTDFTLNTLAFHSLNGFISTLSLSCVTPLPTGVTCAFNPASLVPSGPVTFAGLSLKASSATLNGFYPITVRSAAGTLVKNTTFTLNVGGPNFIPTITPGTAASLLGTPATYTVTLLTAGGMSTPVDVSCESGAPGVVCSASPNQITPGVTPGNQSVITVTGTPGITPLATTNILVKSGSIDLDRHRSTVVTYMPRDFVLTTTTPARTVNAASSITNGVTVKALNGFAGPVALSCAIEGAPAGMSCSMPVSVNPSASGTGLAMTVTTSALTPAGTYTVDVHGSNSGQTRSMAFTVAVRDFSLDISPVSQTIPGAGTGTTTFSLTLTALNGFATSVSLSCLSPLPVGLTCSFSPGSLVPSGSGTPSTLTVNVSASNPQGDHPLTIRAASGGLVRQQSVTVTHGP